MSKQSEIARIAVNTVDTGNVVILCEQLTKRYRDGNILAVDRLDLSVSCGEIFGLLGPNGAGKTTTVGMLTTLVIPTSGKATIAGIDVVAHPAQVKQLIGVVAQTNNLDRSLNVWENLYYHGRLFGMGAFSGWVPGRAARQRTSSWLTFVSKTALRRMSQQSPEAWQSGFK